MHKLESIEQRVIDWKHLKEIIQAPKDKQCSPTFITYLNPYTATLAYREDYPSNNVDGFVLDGTIATKMFNIFNRKKYRTLSFDFSHAAGDVFSLLEKNQQSVAIIGASKEELDVFTSRIQAMFNNLKIVYSHSGYLNIDTQLEQIIGSLNKEKPDFILLSTGAPLQEFIGCRLREKLTGTKVITTCGAFVSQTVSAKREKYYPVLVDKLCLRWLYRLIKEKHIRKRWLKFYPRFVFLYPIMKSSLLLKRLFKR
ncbi:glycosyltransferase [Pseudoalteromonas sp. CO325X]|uniref:WecB/TagA/CpsF family glycosyltransferase n=1 Tax=Pseudoalteromonas sp. CO325X TaxID=1777262 RepID=UPI001023D95C|nr:WecB/TagA/CpsF family glycosyltransferase [Pseudoalteromonas sp. CO325X]RZF79180.1 glycosyltransferase [Pseudoalteromonas sp. CO325X]